MEKEKYIESLENLLIFMCQTYKENESELKALSLTENNDAYLKVSKIQGSNNIAAISSMANLNFVQPHFNFKEVVDTIIDKRSEIR